VYGFTVLLDTFIGDNGGVGGVVGWCVVVEN